jgi:hypothetical protein
LGGNLFEGKVILDKTFGHLAYGCVQCCGYDWTLISGLQPVVIVGSPQIPVPLSDLNKAFSALQHLGITGEVTPVAFQEFGSGKKAVAFVILSHLPSATIRLQQPKSDEVAYAQDVEALNRWNSYSTTPKTFERRITLKASDKPGTVLVTVELSNGASQGFEVCCWTNEPNPRP